MIGKCKYKIIKFRQKRIKIHPSNSNNNNSFNFLKYFSRKRKIKVYPAFTNNII